MRRRPRRPALRGKADGRLLKSHGGSHRFWSAPTVSSNSGRASLCRLQQAHLQARRTPRKCQPPWLPTGGSHAGERPTTELWRSCGQSYSSLEERGRSLQPFLFVAVIRATRRILAIGAQLSVAGERLNPAQFGPAMTGLGVNASALSWSSPWPCFCYVESEKPKDSSVLCLCGAARASSCTRPPCPVWWTGSPSTALTLWPGPAPWSTT